ncbi:hypothetical protein SARC_01923 [Sphaeroforma arctica JP610]|uniref:Uncharacterized protein n=1 Tax=Sphaeroforma arctica JP610 TaxID=667725 RepID=A0A0L0GAL2_9EUKA|nr:hypothetical protein SARC_01923 [Sphaeroforma arctica JP610]KNC85931.1 hypothetical protein SARC_01923 [Sphaeroforma arctica JP610]|eukprot:XP_014159833.1 hypothetical protein SARC_01923 [Sphaeroforma arctica JP610]
MCTSFQPAISEQDVVRNVIYLLEGIDGEYMKIVDRNPPVMQQNSNDSDDMMQDGTDHLMGDSPEPTTPSVSDFRVDIHAAVDNSTRRLIRENMAPKGLCFKYLETFINSNSATGHDTGSQP